MGGVKEGMAETREKGEKRGGRYYRKDATWRNGAKRFMVLHVIERWMVERYKGGGSGGGGTEGKEGGIMK